MIPCLAHGDTNPWRKTSLERQRGEIGTYVNDMSGRKYIVSPLHLRRFSLLPSIISHIMTTLQKKNKTTRLWFSRRGWCQWSRTPCVIPILIPHQWIDHPWNEKKDWSSDSSPLSLSWQNHSSYYVPPLLPTIPPWKDSRRWSQISSTIVYTAGERTGTIIISQPIFDCAANLSWKKTP